MPETFPPTKGALPPRGQARLVPMAETKNNLLALVARAISEGQFLAIGELAPSLFNELVLSAALLARAQRLCQLRDHPADDCLYLALAEQRSAVLLTQDQRLLRRVQEVPQAAGLAMTLEELVLS